MDPRLNHVVRNAALGNLISATTLLHVHALTFSIDQSIIKAVSPLETSPKRYDLTPVIPRD